LFTYHTQKFPVNICKSATVQKWQQCEYAKG